MKKSFLGLGRDKEGPTNAQPTSLQSGESRQSASAEESPRNTEPLNPGMFLCEYIALSSSTSVQILTLSLSLYLIIFIFCFVVVFFFSPFFSSPCFAPAIQ